jgi:AraC-like DNA-binding protein
MNFHLNDQEMFYQKFPPSFALKPYIMCYYIWEQNEPMNGPLEVHSPPSGLGGMVFNYGEPNSVLDKNGQWVNVPNSFVAGQFTRNYILRLGSRFGMIGIVFWPIGLTYLLNIPMLDFTDQRIDLHLILGQKAGKLEQKVMKSNTHSQRIAVLERFLLNKFSKITINKDTVEQAFNNIWQHKGIIPIRKLADNIHLSPRQFRRRFTEKIGISPKLCSRIKRFNYISGLSSIQVEKWMDMVHKGGYYDQAHFIKYFSDFSGKNPTEYLNYTRSLTAIFGA